MTRHEVIARAFPGLPASMFYLLTDGELNRLVPNWSDRLARYFNEASGDGFPTGYAVERGLADAWQRVRADYDAADAAELAREQAEEAEAKRIDEIVHGAWMRRDAERERSAQPELL